MMMLLGDLTSRFEDEKGGTQSLLWSKIPYVGIQGPSSIKHKTPLCCHGETHTLNNKIEASKQADVAFN